VIIPRIIHQTAPSFDALAPDLKANIERLRALNPGWEYRFYDDAAVKDYLTRSLGPQLTETWRRIHPVYGVVLADLFRYVVILVAGGVYLDVKSYATRPLDEIIRPDDEFLLSHWPNGKGEPHYRWGMHPEIDFSPRGEFQQWHVIGKPQHPFPRAVLSRAFRNMQRYEAERDGIGQWGVIRLAGPICYTNAIWPILGDAPHRLIDSHALGLRYSIWPDLDEHRSQPSHYTMQTEPLMLPGKR
jgi:mannosyltransferase OCH1-like enzyme